MNFIAIDSSINNVGWCIGSSKAGYLKSGVIRSKGDNDCEKLACIARELKAIIGAEIEHAFIETTASFSYGRSSHDGQSLNQAALHKLNRAIGAIMLTLSEKGITVHEIPVSEWKGRRSKGYDQMLAQQISQKKAGKDESDAIMLAEYCRGRKG